MNSLSNKLVVERRNRLMWGGFMLLLGYPFVAILGNSFTFYIFLFILYFSGNNRQFFLINNVPKKLLVTFLFMTLVSLIFAPWGALREFTFNPIILYIQFIYWIMLSFLIITLYEKLNIDHLLKWLIIGLFFQLLTFYFIDRLTLDFSFITFNIANYKTRNFVMFQLIAITPLALAYFDKKNKKWLPFAVFTLASSAILSGGRAGAVIVTLLCLLFVFRQLFFKRSTLLIASIFLMLIITSSTVRENIFGTLSEVVSPYNARLANLLVGQAENTSLSEDKSLLERKLLIEKGKEIFSSYPILGIGIGNFYNFDAKLEILSDVEFARIQDENTDYYNKRSSHNSYVQILSEMGIIGFCLFISLIAYPIYIMSSKGRYKNSWTFALILSLLGISIHFFSISAAYGANAWFIIGLANAEAVRLQKRSPLLLNK